MAGADGAPLRRHSHPEERCGDRKCWRRKVAAHVDRVRSRVAANGVELLDVTCGNGGKAKDGPVPMHRIERATEETAAKRKKPPRAMLIVDGAEAGTVIDGWVRSQPKENDWETERKRDREEHEAHVRTRLPLLGRVVDALNDWEPGMSGRVVRATASAPVMEVLCRLAEDWRSTSSLARKMIPDLELDEHGQVPMEARRRTEGLLGEMRPERRLLLLLASVDLDYGWRGSARETDMLTTIAELLGVEGSE